MKPRLLAYAQLMRLPNVFTAFADILLGACAAGYVTDRNEIVLLLALASGCLYCGGMVWNDYFDRTEDAKTRPNRPIPSGRITTTTAAAPRGGDYFWPASRWQARSVRQIPWESQPGSLWRFCFTMRS